MSVGQGVKLFERADNIADIVNLSHLPDAHAKAVVRATVRLARTFLNTGRISAEHSTIGIKCKQMRRVWRHGSHFPYAHDIAWIFAVIGSYTAVDANHQTANHTGK